MRNAKRLSSIVLTLLVLLAFDIRNANALMLILNSSSVIGGNGAWDYNNYDVGGYNAFYVVDNQTGPITEAVGNYWLGQEKQLNQYFVLDLGAAYPIREIDLFNTHNATVNDRWTKNFHVDAANAVTLVNGQVDYDLVSPVQILSGTLTQGNSAGDPITPDVYSLNLGTDYRYIRFTAEDYYGSAGIGLNEIRVVVVPEPSAGMLLVLGTAAIGIARRRRL